LNFIIKPSSLKGDPPVEVFGYILIIKGN